MTFKRPPPRPAKQIGEGYTLRARPVAVSSCEARMSVPVPKFAYVRDTRLQAMCRAMSCRRCGSTVGVTWAHSNQGGHGKGKAIKASDVFVAAMCQACHEWLDQGPAPQEVKEAAWEAAHRLTKLHALANGLWPADIPCPGYEQRKEPA